MAAKAHLMSQKGFAMHKPTARNPKIMKPRAEVLTTPAQLENAQGKDERKKERVTALQRKRLFGIADAHHGGWGGPCCAVKDEEDSGQGQIVPVLCCL